MEDEYDEWGDDYSYCAKDGVSGEGASQELPAILDQPLSVQAQHQETLETVQEATAAANAAADASRRTWT